MSVNFYTLFFVRIASFFTRERLFGISGLVLNINFLPGGGLGAKMLRKSVFDA